MMDEGLSSIARRLSSRTCNGHYPGFCTTYTFSQCPACAIIGTTRITGHSPNAISLAIAVDWYNFVTVFVTLFIPLLLFQYACFFGLIGDKAIGLGVDNRDGPPT